MKNICFRNQQFKKGKKLEIAGVDTTFTIRVMLLTS
jgi:hypothetical protein